MTHVSQNEKIKSASGKRKEIRRKKDTVIAIGVIMVLLVCIAVAGVAFLKVGTVEVADNYGRYTDDRIIEIAGISSDSSFLMLNEEKIADTVCLALPYIEAISVSRTLPDHVQLLVTYAEPAFAVDCGQLWLILSANGKVLETTQVVPSNLSELKGVLVKEYSIGKTAVFENDLYFNHASDLYAAAKENKLGDIRTLQIDQSGYVFMSIGNRFFVQSPTVQALLKEMPVLKKVMDEREDKKTAFSFTLAADGSITISNREGSEEENTTVPFDDPYLNMDSELVGEEAATGNSELVGDEAPSSAPVTQESTTVQHSPSQPSFGDSTVIPTTAAPDSGDTLG